MPSTLFSIADITGSECICCPEVIENNKNNESANVEDISSVGKPRSESSLVRAPLDKQSVGNLHSESSLVGAPPDNEISILSNIIDEVGILLFNSPNPFLEIKRNLIWMQNHNYQENGVGHSRS